MNSTKTKSEWRVVAASVRGTNHERTGQPCQDAHHWQQSASGVLIAAVADGAGSAPLGELGAAIAVKRSVETISLQKMPLDQFCLANALKNVLTDIEATAAQRQLPVRDFATTLIIVVATPELVAAAQIGDGAVIVQEQEGNLTALTRPQSGEYINETTFLVSPNALKNAQITVWHGKPSHLAIFSDGLQMLALKMPEGTPHPPFFSPLFRFVQQSVDETDAKKQLETFMRSPRVTQRTDDDLTLLLATIQSETF